MLTVYSEQLNIQYKKSRYPRRSNANRYRIFYYSKMRYQSSIKNQNRIILILNPTTKEHWIYQRFFEDKGIQEGLTQRKTTQPTYTLLTKTT